MQVTTLCLVTLLLLPQVVCRSVVRRSDPFDTLQDSEPPRRLVRMTPLWRSIGAKPLGAYCQGNYECSTQFCRDGHCSFSHAVLSKK